MYCWILENLVSVHVVSLCMWSKYTQAWGLNRLPHRAVLCENQRSEVRCSVFWKGVCRHMCRDHAEHKYKIGSHYSMHCAASQPCLTAYCIWRNTSMIQAFTKLCKAVHLWFFRYIHWTILLWIYMLFLWARDRQRFHCLTWAQTQTLWL